MPDRAVPVQQEQALLAAFPAGAPPGADSRTPTQVLIPLRQRFSWTGGSLTPVCIDPSPSLMASPTDASGFRSRSGLCKKSRATRGILWQYIGTGERRWSQYQTVFLGPWRWSGASSPPISGLAASSVSTGEWRIQLGPPELGDPQIGPSAAAATSKRLRALSRPDPLRPPHTHHSRSMLPESTSWICGSAARSAEGQPAECVGRQGPHLCSIDGRTGNQIGE